MEKALQNDLVLSKVFNRLDFCSLKVARQVNKYWNAVANPKLNPRLGPFIFSHDKENCKELLEQEQTIRFPSLSANPPFGLHLRSTGERVWNIVKYLGENKTWTSRITMLQLSNFWASDLNQLLPYLLANLQSLKVFHVSAVNDFSSPTKSVIPENFVVPTILPNATFSIETLYVSFGGCNQPLLDPSFLLKCTSINEFFIEITGLPLCFKFLRDLANLNPGEKLLPSCSSVHFQIKFVSADNNIAPEIVENVAIIANRIAPKHMNLNLSSTSLLELPEVFQYMTFFPESLTVDVPALDLSTFHTNWLIRTLKKFEICADLNELSLRPAFYSHGPEPDDVEGLDMHNFEKLKSLIVLFDKEAGVDDVRYKNLLSDASLCLPKIERIKLSGLRLANMWGLADHILHMCFLNGMQGFINLRKLWIEMEDKAGELVKVGKNVLRGERMGVLEPSLLTELSLKTLEVHCTLNYEMTMDSILYALFTGYEPYLSLIITLKTKSGRSSKKFTVGEFKEALANANPEFNNIAVEDESEEEID